MNRAAVHCAATNDCGLQESSSSWQVLGTWLWRRGRVWASPVSASSRPTSPGNGATWGTWQRRKRCAAEPRLFCQRAWGSPTSCRRRLSLTGLTAGGGSLVSFLSWLHLRRTVCILTAGAKARLVSDPVTSCMGWCKPGAPRRSPLASPYGCRHGNFVDRLMYAVNRS